MSKSIINKDLRNLALKSFKKKGQEETSTSEEQESDEEDLKGVFEKRLSDL